jgi:hypothetical protein
MNGWFYRTREASDSRDSRRHLELLLAGPLKRPSVITLLRERGCWLDVSIFYAYTGGGPTISPNQMKGLAEADVDVWWDLYREPEEEA